MSEKRYSVEDIRIRLRERLANPRTDLTITITVDMAREILSYLEPLSSLSQETEEEWQKLDDIDPGEIFETKEGVRAVKSEYKYSNEPHSQWKCILLESGEYAHFDKKNDTEVRVIDIDAYPQETEECKHIEPNGSSSLKHTGALWHCHLCYGTWEVYPGHGNFPSPLEKIEPLTDSDFMPTPEEMVDTWTLTDAGREKLIKALNHLIEKEGR
jgi:hypothetical protein